MPPKLDSVAPHQERSKPLSADQRDQLALDMLQTALCLRETAELLQQAAMRLSPPRLAPVRMVKPIYEVRHDA